MKQKKSVSNAVRLFVHDGRSVGVVLLTSTALSLVLSNGKFMKPWTGIWNHEIAFLHQVSLPHSPTHFINEVFMALFFLLAGMEIKRELIDGELSSARRAALPAVAAIGGMFVPALLFSLFNKGSDTISGWAIPASTDIAFTLGIASLLGPGVPSSLKVFLTALAIIDDLGAIIIIAFFYGEAVHFQFILAAIFIGILSYWYNHKVRRFGLIQVLEGLLLWWLVYRSGIHATVAGVFFAFLLPKEVIELLEKRLHLPVYFFILPLFALANTAIVFPTNFLTALTTPLSWGIILGLFVGKPLGICLSSWLLVKQKKAVLPSGTSWRQLFGAGMLAGIGFTMSIFISVLAFNREDVTDIAKIAVLVASFLAMITGFIWLKYFSASRRSIS